MSTRTLLCVLCLTSAVTAAPDTNALLKAVEARYNRSQSLRLDFSETYAGMKRPVQRESGVLWLRKPGKMRWDYIVPPGKVFISDGKEVVLYTPGEPTAEKSKLKESEDMRAPLAFLLGKLDFKKEFRSFQTRAEGSEAQSGGAMWIVAEPKSQNLVYTKVEFLAMPDGEIRRVRVTGQDQSTLDFTFTNEQLNSPVSPGLFVFHPPPGVQIVEGQP